MLLAFEGNLWDRRVELGTRIFENRHFSGLGTTSFFLFENIHLDAGVGLAYATFDAAQNGEQKRRYREMGAAAKVGAGYEAFLNGTIALGIDASYTRHFYANASFDTFGAGLALRWY